MNNLSIKKRAGIIVVLVIALVVLSVLAIVTAMLKKDNYALVAKVYRDNELIYEIDLDKVEEPYEITISYGDEYNIIEVRKGSIGVIKASCPDLLCKNVGFISNSLMPITCLPNHLVIKVESQAKDEKSGVEIDGQAY